MLVGSLRRTLRLLLVSQLAISAAKASDATIVDLSHDFAEDAAAMAASPGSLAIREAASADPLIRTVLVLQDGKVVASYARKNDAMLASDLFSVHSVTKSWTSLLVGMAIDDGELELNATLGDIFSETEGAWDGVADGTLEFRKNITLEEILTMTSGLVGDPLTFEFGESGALGGDSLSKALAEPSIGKKGVNTYLSTSNILSYVIFESTGMTPREYLAKNVLPHLGIKNSEIDWEENADGMQTAFHGIKLTTHQMAKFGQFYLQLGKTGSLDNDHVVSQSWIDASFTAHARSEEFWAD